MDLKDNELRSLMALLRPKFESVDQRMQVLNQAFGFEDATALSAIINTETASPEQFTAALLKTLHNENIRIGTGKLALAQLLESMQQANRAGDVTFSEAVQPFVDLLELPSRSGQVQPAPLPVPVVTETPTIAGDADQPAHKKGRRRRRRRSIPARMARRVLKLFRWQVVAVVILIAITVPPVSTLALVTDANARVQQSISDVRRVMDSVSHRSFTELSMNDFQRLQLAVSTLADNLNHAQQVTGLLRRFSGLRPDLASTLNAMDAADEVSQAAQDMLSGLQPTLFYMVNSKSPDIGDAANQLSSGERIVELLTSGQGLFQSANGHLQAAKAKLDNLSPENLSTELLLNAQELQKYYEKLQDINQILLSGPDLLTKALGLTDGQNYLILSQNSDELRPSGGYISTYGWMRIRRVQIVDYGYGATTELSPNPPPVSMASELKIPKWWLQREHPIYTAWDGSWYADFSETAKMASWFYDNGNNPRSPVDGVIGIDLYGFEYILGALGSVTVPDYNEVVTADNFREVIYKIRESSEGQEVAHKKFLASLYQQILQSWQSSTKQAGGDKLFAAIIKALQEKHILMYFKDPQLNKAIDLLGWTGTQPPATDHDYLMVADANDLGSKSNRSISRSMTYDVKIQPDGALQSRVAISYDFPASVAENDPGVNPKNYTTIDYGNLMQVFVPASSISTSTSSLQKDLNTVPTANYTIFATDTTVKYDDSERFQISYTTPVLVKAFGPYRQYRLLLQKQPGTAGDLVDVQVTLPVGAKLVSVSPDPTTSYDLESSVLEFRTRLTIDQWIELIYTMN